MRALLFALVVLVCDATVFRPFSDMPVIPGTINVVSSFPSAGVPPVLTNLTLPTYYDSSLIPPTIFSFTATATYTGNNSIDGITINLVNNGDIVTITGYATVISTNSVQLEGLEYLRFMNSGTYSVSSVVLETAIGSQYTVTLPGGFKSVWVWGAFAPQTVTGFQLQSPQTGGCDTSSCFGGLNGSVTLSPGISGSYVTTLLRSSHASSGVYFISRAVTEGSTGFSDFNIDTATPITLSVGSFVGGVYESFIQSSSSVTAVPFYDSLSISLQVSSPIFSFYHTEAEISSFQSNVVLSTGSLDVTAPTCTGVSVTSESILLGSQTYFIPFTVSCADESGGSGLWTNGVILRYNITSTGTIFDDIVIVRGGSSEIVLPPYINVIVSVLGVFSVDNAGNAVLYGSCGTATGIDTVCKGVSPGSTPPGPCVSGLSWGYGGVAPCYPCSSCNITFEYCQVTQDTICYIPDECSSHPCGDDPHAECYDFYGGPGSYSCFCDSGYSGTPPYTPCTSTTNVCLSNPNICYTYNGTVDSNSTVGNSYCNNYYENFVYCTCDADFYGGGSPPYNTPCIEDVNECANSPNLCTLENSACVNFIGPSPSYYCACNDGYYSETGVACIADVNECLTGNNTCANYPHAECYNYDGPSPSYYCYCDGGYTGSPPYSACTLIDYCSYYVNPCYAGYVCQNVLWGYQCVPGTPPVDCGVLLSDGDCQVGYLNPPQCCTRISDQQPFASASAQGSNLVVSIIANTVPSNYEYAHGLTQSTFGSAVFASGCSFDATQGAANNTYQTMFVYDVPLDTLSHCLSVSKLSDRVRFDGYIGLSLEYTPWGNSASVGLWWFYLRVEILNSTQVVALLSITPESYQNTIDVEIHPQATLMHCTNALCTAEDVTYFAREGDVEYYQLVVDAGSVSGTASLTTLLLEDINHADVAVAQPTVVSQSGLTVIFSFVVPSGTALVVKFMRALVSVDFLDAFTNDGATYQTQGTQDLLLAGSRFEILANQNPNNNDASSATIPAAAAALLCLVFSSIFSLLML